jgi:hypothetical protein
MQQDAEIQYYDIFTGAQMDSGPKSAFFDIPVFLFPEWQYLTYNSYVRK